MLLFSVLVSVSSQVLDWVNMMLLLLSDFSLHQHDGKNSMSSKSHKAVFSCQVQGLGAFWAFLCQGIIGNMRQTWMAYLRLKKLWDCGKTRHTDKLISPTFHFQKVRTKSICHPMCLSIQTLQTLDLVKQI